MNFAPPASSMSNSPQTRFSSVGSRNTVEPLEPYRARLSATFVPNTSRNRSTFSTVVVARIMTVLLTSGLLRISLLADRSVGVRLILRTKGARERDPGQLFGDCPQAALDGRWLQPHVLRLTSLRAGSHRESAADVLPRERTGPISVRAQFRWPHSLRPSSW